MKVRIQISKIKIRHELVNFESNSSMWSQRPKSRRGIKRQKQNNKTVSQKIVFLFRNFITEVKTKSERKI